MPALNDQLELPNGQILPNRIMKSALSESLADQTGSPNERLEQLYTTWGSGGFGLLITGNVMVDEDHLGEAGNVVLNEKADLEAFTKWAKAGRDRGTPIWMQINHPGRQANPMITGKRPVAPSAIAPNLPGLPVPDALTGEQIKEIIERFATTAKLAESAGFDGVEIHAAHGYLVSQFLSPLSNQRDDEWGGDIEGRMKFAIEIVRSIRAAVSPGFAVGIKLNSADFQRGGFTEDESREVVKRLAQEKIDLIEISGGTYESAAMIGRPQVKSASTKAREAYFLEYAEKVRVDAAGIPIAVTGGFRSREAMNQAIADGDCDLVGIGRPTALIPDAAEAVLTGGTDRLPTPKITLGAPPAVLKRLPALKAAEGGLDMQWHLDQIRRLGDGRDTDPARPAWRTAISAARHHGVDAFRQKRGGVSQPVKNRSVDKFTLERAVGRYVANPLVKALGKVGIQTTFATDLETTGRKTGLARRVPVSASFDETGAWVISQHGTRSGWGSNVTSNPAVRIRQGSQWRTGTAEFVYDDDVAQRARSFAPNPAFGALALATFRAMQTKPISVRITFTD
ncbi:nitroreductase family deazaflavin-dependent oxidoreductase [Smaragdicoccus niigatensis]|uniref:nitroreductase family deazaflavin-dependent oxidoreductase n=1 Tax=Smaragdicoccus niigatensis TaxID=359359 RepID=UPI000365E449|nr:nitroreductase family deazaflavin-dependent oxidoreductase [Smaragdicoccus niigatensis]